MATKRPSFTALLSEAGGKKKADEQQEDTPAPKKSTPATREGQKQVGCWISRDASRQLKDISNQEDKSLQSLLLEAIDDLFRKYGRQPIAQKH